MDIKDDTVQSSAPTLGDRPKLDYGLVAATRYRLFDWFGLKSSLPFRTPSAIISFKDGISIIDYVESPTMDETKAVIRYLAAANIYQRRLWDFSKVAWPFSPDEVAELARYGDSHIDRPGKLAVIISDDLGAGSAHLFAKHRAADSDTNASEFRSESDAVGWLLGDLSGQADGTSNSLKDEPGSP